jgi:SAM-dependent methyltransferase
MMCLRPGATPPEIPFGDADPRRSCGKNERVDFGRPAADGDCSFEALLVDARQARFKGWDWSWMGDRYWEAPVSWDYSYLVNARLPDLGVGAAVLDMGTGGGELLRTFIGLPPDTRATEGYQPNVPVARAALQSHGIQVDEVRDDDHLPYPSDRFDLILNRHESFSAGEVARVLRPGGVFVTQQVGGLDLAELNEQLGAPSHSYADWNLDLAVGQIHRVGLGVLERGEEQVEATFRDVGAVVQFLRIAPWQVPGFTVDGYRSQLRRLHEALSDGPLVVHAHRFYLVAQLP